MEPDPKCQQCRGTGRIELFTSVIACECLFFRNKDDDSPRRSCVDTSVGLNLSFDDVWGGD